MFFNQPHTEHGQNENGDHRPGHPPFSGDNAGKQLAKTVIARRVIDGGMTPFYFRDRRQDLHPKIGREHHRDKPRCNQGEADNPEHIAGVFPCGRLGKAIRHKANGRHQGTGQHGRSGMAPGEGRGFDSVVTFLHFHHHHFDGDNGIINQQAEGEDQGAQRNAVKVYPRGFHHHENDSQRQRYRRRNDNTHAPAHADKTHHHDHKQGDEEFDHELIDRRANIHGLVGDLGQGHAQRQAVIYFRRFRIQRFSQRQTVPAFTHHDAQQKGGLMLIAYQHRRGIFVASLNRCHIGQLERFALSHKRRIADFLQFIERAVQADKNLRASGLNGARRG